MKEKGFEEEVIVHPVDGMQISEGYIREDESAHFLGYLPGIEPLVGNTIAAVLDCLEKKAKAYYGDDVIVEVAPPHAHA